MAKKFFDNRKFVLNIIDQFLFVDTLVEHIRWLIS